MAAPVVDAEYLRQVDRARRQLRALISNKGCAPIMLRLAYVLRTCGFRFFFFFACARLACFWFGWTWTDRPQVLQCLIRLRLRRFALLPCFTVEQACRVRFAVPAFVLPVQSVVRAGLV
jgi:hypothetical protein